MSWRELLWGWHGRINRLQYFVALFAFAFALAALTYTWLPFPVLDAAGEIAWEDSGQWIATWGVTIVNAVFVSSLLVRRLHDIGLPGWWAAALFTLGLLWTQVAFFRPELFWVRSVIGTPAAIAVLCGFFVPSQSGSNRFGPKPEAGLPKRW